MNSYAFTSSWDDKYGLKLKIVWSLYVRGHLKNFTEDKVDKKLKTDLNVLKKTDKFTFNKKILEIILVKVGITSQDILHHV